MIKYTDDRLKMWRDLGGGIQVAQLTAQFNGTMMYFTSGRFKPVDATWKAFDAHAALCWCIL